MAGLDLAKLREALSAEPPAAAHRQLVVLAEEWFALLLWLLGPTLSPLLQEAEEEIDRGDLPPDIPEEGQ